MLKVIIALALASSVSSFSLSPCISSSLSCRSSLSVDGLAARLGSGRQPLVSLGLRRAKTALALNMQIKGVYNDNSEKPKASKELMQIRFASVDADKLGKWIKKWPFGGKKDGFGLPKTMLPLAAEPYGAGVKIIFKGTADPWLQIDLEGDTVSALKQREEAKICDKLKEDLGTADCGASGLNEKTIPVVEPPKKEEPPAAEDSPAAPAEEAPAS